MEIRTATLEDVAAIADLHARSWRATYRGSYRDEYLDGPVDEERRSVWTARLADPPPNQFVVVAESADEIVGFACVYGGHDVEWGSFLDNIHGDPRRHRVGIGSQLFMAVVAWCRANYPANGLHLKVLERNFAARRFYETFGGVDGGGTPASNEWVIDGVQVRRYTWTTLDSVSDREHSREERGG